jgi:small-conductance mechanosensitive channel
VIIIGLIIIAFLFEHWYTAAVSLGLFSLILGFALQTPISSFIGWLYIIARTPYKVGDRIQINDFKGDVVEIGYLDTTLWEFSGDYLTSDLPSGRLIRFPNTLILQYQVYNYSWRKFPYIWNEIPFHVAYESDLTYVAHTLRDVAKEVLGPGIAEKVEELKRLVQQTPVDELAIKEYPFVTYRINANTWVEASVYYLVNPKEAARVRTEIIRKAIATLLLEPDKVMFPKSNAR